MYECAYACMLVVYICAKCFVCLNMSRRMKKRGLMELEVEFEITTGLCFEVPEKHDAKTG